MSHDHDHALPSQGLAGTTPFAIAVGLNLAFVVGEALWAKWAGSSALLADAVHNLGDVLGLTMAWLAMVLARRAPSAIHTYGLRRTTVLAALANAMLMLIASAAVVWEAVAKLSHPQAVSGPVIMVVAAVGIVVNVGAALPLLRQRSRDMNTRAAVLHLLADAAVSVGVVLSGVAVIGTGWTWVDPASGLIIAGLVAASAGKLLAEALHLTLDGVPRGIDALAVRAALESLPGVQGVHDLHIRALSTTENSLTAHLVAEEASRRTLVTRAREELAHRFGLRHVTLQVESADEACACGQPCDQQVVGAVAQATSAGS
jgi:cobalt-zinc-cadmium efflux system protein